MINTEIEREKFEEYKVSLGESIERKGYHYSDNQTHIEWNIWKKRANISAKENREAMEKLTSKHGQMIGQIHNLRIQLKRVKENSVEWVKVSVQKPTHNNKVMVINDDDGFELGFCDHKGTFRDGYYGEKIKYAMMWAEIPSTKD